MGRFLMTWCNDATIGKDRLLISCRHATGTIGRELPRCLPVATLWIGTVALFGIMFSGCARKAQPAPPPALPVQVVRAVQQDVPVYGDWIATLDGFVNAQIQPEVTGYLIQQLYREGSYVHKDQVLFQIDPQTFQASLNQAEAQLAQAQAHLALAEINVKRDTPLVQQRAIAQS